jgi:hypothetical protein
MTVVNLHFVVPFVGIDETYIAMSFRLELRYIQDISPLALMIVSHVGALILTIMLPYHVR